MPLQHAKVLTPNTDRSAHCCPAHAWEFFWREHTHSTHAPQHLTGAGDRCLQVLIDTIDALSEPLHEVVQRPPGRAEADRADVHAVALYLFAQLYIRQAQRADAMDVWPSSSPQAAAAAAAAVRSLCHMRPLPPPRPGCPLQPHCVRRTTTCSLVDDLQGFMWRASKLVAASLLCLTCTCCLCTLFTPCHTA